MRLLVCSFSVPWNLKSNIQGIFVDEMLMYYQICYDTDVSVDKRQLIFILTTSVLL